MALGGKVGRRGFLQPNNQGMVTRANTRIEATIAAFSAQQDNALKADGVQMFIWHRGEAGGRLCTCTSSVKTTPAARGNDPTRVLNAGSEVIGGSQPSRATGVRMFGVSAESIADDGLEVPLSDDSWGDEEVDGGGDDEVNHTTFIGKDGDEPYASEDEMLSGMGSGAGSFGTSPGFTDGGYTTADSVSCPVCAGASYLEAWQPQGGRRLVMAFHEADDFDGTGSLDLNAHPNVMTLDQGQYVEWSMKLPKYFTASLRSGVWNGRQNLKDAAPVSIWNDGAYALLTPTLLNILGSSGLGGVRRFRFDAKERTLLTHFEMILQLADLPFAQFPPLNAPSDVEFQEYMTAITIEVGADVRIDRGDLISDFKYRKLWRVTNLVRRSTAAGRNMPAQVDLQPVATFDKFHVLNPYYVPVEQGAKMFSGRNEPFQGGLGQALTDRSV